MAMTKRKKKILLICIPVVVVIAAIIAAVVLLLPGGPQRYLQDISAYDNSAQPVMVVKGGLEQALVPLPKYSVSEEVPPEYTRVENADQIANRFSYEYQDVYCTSAGDQVILRQQTAGENVPVIFPSEIQRAVFAGMEVYYAIGDRSFTAAWICGDTLFSLESQSIALSLEEMLEFVNLVDYSSPSEPEIRPLEFVEGSVEQYENSTGKQIWRIGGNPQLPETLEYYTFTQTPEGYTETQASSYFGMPERTLTEAGIEIGTSEDWMEAYRSPFGGVVTLVNRTIGDDGQIFYDVPGSSNNEALEVEEVTVNGMEGRLYAGPSYYELVLLGDYLYVDLTYRGSIAQEDFLALAELIGK